MNLKLKAVIYRYTNIYLAKKEETEYLNSRHAENRIIELSSVIGSYEMTREIIIGLWQAEHGFLTVHSELSKIPVIGYLHRVYLTLKTDLSRGNL